MKQQLKKAFFSPWLNLFVVLVTTSVSRWSGVNAERGWRWEPLGFPQVHLISCDFVHRRRVCMGQ